jgi:hypothetical protein
VEQPSLTVSASPIPKPTHYRGVPILSIEPGDPIPTAPGAFAVFVTPALARDWMGRYTDPEKRTIREAKVVEFHADMEDGKWVWGTANIIFTENGRTKLDNGHHRLTASGRCVRAKGVWMMVITGAEPEARAVTDTGLTRSGADVIRMDGGKRYATEISSHVKMVLVYEQTEGTTQQWRPGAYALPTKRAILDAWRADQATWASVAHAVKGGRKHLPVGIPPRTLGAFVYLAEKKHPGDGIAFFLRVCANAIPAAYSALVATVRNRPTGSGTQLEHDRFIMETLIRAFNADRRGDESWLEPRRLRFTLSSIA